MESFAIKINQLCEAGEQGGNMPGMASILTRQLGAGFGETMVASKRVHEEVAAKRLEMCLDRPFPQGWPPAKDEGINTGQEDAGHFFQGNDHVYGNLMEGE